MVSRKQIMLFIGLLLLAIIIYHLGVNKLNECNLLNLEIDPKDLPDKNSALSTKSFVESAVEKAKNGVSNKELDSLRNNDEYLIGYSHDGTLVVHGVSTDVFCDREFPLCHTHHKNLIGKNLYNFKTVGGVYEVRLWIDIANKGGGWAAAYWKDSSGKFHPKYYYIQKVPDRDLILASGYFAKN